MSKDRREATCRHYLGTRDSYVCGAGVNLLDFNGGKEQAIARVIPCFGPCGLFPGDNPSATCPNYSPKTKAELEAEEKEFAEHLDKMLKAREAIVKATNGERGVSGLIACPICDGNLKYYVAGLNGHIHAKCSTEGCVSWME